MTIREVSRLTGVSPRAISDALKLPQGTSSDERLGRLKRRYGFEMDDVRQVVEREQRW
jgi:hypothetical protein